MFRKEDDARVKYNNTFFMQVSREIWEHDISDNAKLLFFWLNELEQRYTGVKEDFFFRTDADLAADLGWSLKTLKKAKAELKTTDLIATPKVHFTDKETGKKSRKWVTGYRIIK